MLLLGGQEREKGEKYKKDEFERDLKKVEN